MLKKSCLNKKNRFFFVCLFMCCAISLSFGSIALARSLSASVQVQPIGVLAPPAGAESVSDPQAGVSTSSHDIWSVSTYYVCEDADCHLSGTEPTFNHYDGSHWIMSAPVNPGGFEYITKMVEPDINAVYGIGAFTQSYTPNGYMPDILKWSNGKWARIAVPYPSNYSNNQSGDFSSIVAVSSWNIYVAGEYRDSNAVKHPILEHYNGSTWSIVSIPANITAINALQQEGTTSTVLAFGTDGATTQVLTLK